ncbi:MAG: tRNA (guanosine(37)-N1)-methyltransferase TrmD [Ruminococcaceae bacterium]|nr:tRNA (guanosine(37)-N1)-methyltransferase TrmD [Oscillospiraceae bacterium]
MRFDIMTLFPELVERVLEESIIGRAQKSGAIKIEAHNIRDYSEDKHRRVDDTPYGGGKGMLMMAPPISRCHSAILEKTGEISPEKRCTVYMSPQGKVLTESMAAELASYDQVVILCGHYEGVDRRIVDEIVDREISIGDYVLTGGELPACILVDCVARLVDGVLADKECFEKESFSNGLLEYPQYTRPFEFHGVTVPEVLISGHHENIEKWREEQALALTRQNRPDLLAGREEKGS